MIKTHRKLVLNDFSNRGNEVSVEVNWNKSKLVKNCKAAKLKVGDTEAIILRDHLWSILFMMADEQQQMNMIPVQTTPMRNYSTVIEVMAQQDLKKGQRYNIPLSVSVNQNTGQMTIKP